MKASAGTRWDPAIVEAAKRLHGGCLGAKVGMPGPCNGQLEPDHIRASGALGMKSRSTLDNCAPMCSDHHRIKTNAGRTWRPLLIEAVDEALLRAAVGDDCGHVDPNPSCAGPCNRADPMQLRATGR
jgi:hypothetical protein